MQTYALKPFDPTIIPIDQEVNAVRDHIREFVKVECTLVGDVGSLDANREPLRLQLLILGGTWVATQPVQAAAMCSYLPERTWWASSCALKPVSRACQIVK